MGRKSKAKVMITQDLINDMKEYGGLYCIGLAYQVRDELDEEALWAIARFYEDYTPRSYKRHYYNFMDKSHRGYYKNPHKTIVRGGVQLNPGWMDDIYGSKNNLTPTEEVFDLVMHGFHGVSSGFESPHTFTVTPVMSPNPLELIEKRRDEIVAHIAQYKKYGEALAEKQNYKTLDT